MSTYTTYHVGSSTALLQHSNNTYIKSSIGGRGNYRKNPEVIQGMSFDTTRGNSITAFQYYPTMTGASTALPSGADKMKDKIFGLFKAAR
jgi:hypothetical protein